MSITIRDVGPNISSFSTSNPNHATSGRILSLTVAADGVRLYAGTYAGVWRSDDGGRNWRQLTRPQPGVADADIAGALYPPHVFDLAASPVDPNLVLAAAARGQFTISRNGIYRSTDGGLNWALVLNSSFVHEIVFAPDDPMLVYAALGTQTSTTSAIAISGDAGQTWKIVSIPGTALHVAVAPQESSGIRRVYAAGANQIWYSTDGGNTWSFDQGTFRITSDRQSVSDFQVACQIAAGQKPSPLGSFAGGTGDSNGSGAHILAVEPGNPARIYLAARGAANGPSYYNNGNNPPDGTRCNTTCARLAGEASLWLGDFRNFDSIGRALWGRLNGPPVYTGVTTPSGNTYVMAKPTSRGFLLFFADNSHVHVSEGTPSSSASWHRLDGKDASAVQQAGQHNNQLFVHADPHALGFTTDFEITLKLSTGVSFPYDQNSVLDKYLAGTIWMANDGGVHWSDNGGRTWNRPTGLETLDPVNIAGLFGIGNRPALYMGTGDNDDFFTRDGGGTWRDPLSACGDCDAWFSDVAQANRVLEFDPRGGGLRIITGTGSSYPDAADSSHNRLIPPPAGSNASSGFMLRGFRPIIQTLATELPLPDGDYVFIGKKADGSRVLFRTRSISSIASQADWENSSKAEQIGPPLPPGPTPPQVSDVAQVAGGHLNPVFYVADIGRSNGSGAMSTGRVFKLDANSGMWNVIVPGGPTGRTASFARQFFVDPYNPELIYLVDLDGIKVSLDGGESWLPENSLTRAVTAGGKLSVSSKTLLTDMLFMRGERNTRFAFGNAGVFCTVNGFEWETVLNSIALPGRPESGFFDPLSDPWDRALYVTLEGRSVLRLSPIPSPDIFQPSSIDLFEFAAIEA
ncbi:MAG: hypothetical protein M3R29_02830 [Verrucomicrobiota bacterium]|nr:hypothetical protein [Verrucomicrobiota bacterium]